MIDITLELGPRMLLYPGDAPPRVRRVSSITHGASLTSSELTLGCHIGTHVDAPGHFLENGAMLDALDLKHFCGPAQIVECANCDLITEDQIDAAKITPDRHLLIKTRNSEMLRRSEFDAAYCYIEPGAAQRLLEFRPLSIGFDYYSLDPLSANDFPTHKAVAQYGIPAFVCLNLANVTPGEYFFIAAPLRIAGLDGLPVRAFLMNL